MKYLAASVALIGAAPPAERVVGGDGTIGIVLAGEALRLKVEPSVPGLPIINPEMARRLGLKGGGFLGGFGVCYRVGHERVCGATRSVKLILGQGATVDRRVGWMSRDYATFADGTIGPGGLPEPVVRFQLRDARAGERQTTLPLEMPGGLGGALFGAWFVLDGAADIGGTKVRLRFDLQRPVTLVTASTAVSIARTYGGVMTAETGRQEIAFGIVRPYRVMTLARPITVAGVTLSRLGVRVTDEDVAGRIPEAGAAAAEQDPDEVVVTARVKRPRPGILILGADALSACSEIVFDKSAKRIRTSCRP